MRRFALGLAVLAWISAPAPGLQVPLSGTAPGKTAVRTGVMAPAPGADDLRAVLASGRGAAAPLGLEAEVVDYTGATVVDETFPVLDADGNVTGSQNWRVVTGTGNCCENYLSSTSNGRLFDFGGDYLYFSDDEGLSWQRVEPADPLPNFGEGAVAVAPDGDIVGVAWNPYYGDRLVPFKYEAEEETWYYTTTKMHTPFFDRESLAAIPGPFTFAGEEYPYVVLLKGGWPSKDPWMISFDGLNYITPSAKFLDQMTQAPTRGWLDFKATPQHDWLQTTYQTRLTALGKSQAISGLGGYVEDGVSRQWGLFGSDLRWSPFDFEDKILPGNGNLLTDSKARLHYVYATEAKITYMMSADGGRHWVTRSIALPKGTDRRPSVDFRASGRLDLTAIAAHVSDGKGFSRDFVYKLSTARDRIRLQTTFLVGDGKLVTGSGVTSSAPRFDFSTITLLPDGRVALSFIDGRYRTPTLAIEQ